ncbi:cell wall integrity and stress response component 4-like [Folsomia candida]|uniref:cell wall integrity and stress response component 4-like n=1 Tax=Folsomia candida TaxID=158441 RepID=UPI0016052D43|nr:cell wall integrity and stress response component 4-like [Folsomia candida]
MAHKFWPLFAIVISTLKGGDGYFLDTNGDMVDGWTQSCSGGYHNREDSVCPNVEMPSLIPADDVNCHDGFWTQCYSGQPIPECSITLRNSSSSLPTKVGILAYITGGASLTLTVTSQNSSVKDIFISHVGWTDLYNFIDISSYSPVQEIKITLSYQHVRYYSVLDQVLVTDDTEPTTEEPSTTPLCLSSSPTTRTSSVPTQTSTPVSDGSTSSATDDTTTYAKTYTTQTDDASTTTTVWTSQGTPETTTTSTHGSTETPLTSTINATLTSELPQSTETRITSPVTFPPTFIPSSTIHSTPSNDKDWKIPILFISLGLLILLCLIQCCIKCMPIQWLTKPKSERNISQEQYNVNAQSPPSQYASPYQFKNLPHNSPLYPHNNPTPGPGIGFKTIPINFNRYPSEVTGNNNFNGDPRLAIPSQQPILNPLNNASNFHQANVNPYPYFSQADISAEYGYGIGQQYFPRLSRRLV